MQYDIFISYRRSDGFSTARLVYDHLLRKGYRTSFDLETLRSGAFDKEIYRRIEVCKDFVVIISKDALQFRENKEDDWVRLEIEHALKCKKNIIPVFLPDVPPPTAKDLPEEIADLAKLNGVKASPEHFDSAIAKICEKLHARRKFGAKLIAMLIMLFVSLSAYCVYRMNQEPIYPRTQQEKQDFGRIYTYLTRQMYTVNQIACGYEKFLDVAERALQTNNLNAIDLEKLAFQNTFRNLTQATFREDFIDIALKSEVIDAAYLEMVPTLYDNYVTSIQNSFNTIVNALAPESMIPKTEQLHLIEVYKKFAGCLSESMGLSFIALTHKVKSAELEEFKLIAAAQLTAIPVLSGVWPTTEEEIKRLMNRGNEQLEILLREEATILGNLKQFDYLSESDLRKQYEQQGYLPEQIDKLIQKIRENSLKRAELNDIKARLEAAKERVRKKFEPFATDEDRILWTKMLCLNEGRLPEEALKALRIMQNNQEKEIAEPLCNVAEKMLTEPQHLPFAAGIVIDSFEPPATSHAIFKVGDVIAKINGEDCINVDIFRTAEGSKYTIYRLNEAGQFEKLTLIMPANQPRTGVMELPL